MTRTLARCCRQRPPIRYRHRAVDDRWCEQIELMGYALRMVASAVPALHGHLPDSRRERAILRQNQARSARPAPPRLHCRPPPSAAPSRLSARLESRVESSRAPSACIPPGQTSRAAAPTNGQERHSRDCIAHNHRRPSRLPHEPARRTRPTDAMNRRPRDPRSCGRSVAALYNTVRPHSAIGNLPPADYAKLSDPAMQRGGTLRSLGGYAPRPVAPPSLQGSNEERTLPVAG